MTLEELQRMFGAAGRPTNTAVGGVPTVNPLLGGGAQQPAVQGQGVPPTGGLDLNALVNTPATQGLGNALNAQAAIDIGRSGTKHITGTSADANSPWNTGFFKNPASARQEYGGVVNDVRGRQAAELHPDVSRYQSPSAPANFVGPTGFTTQQPQAPQAVNPSELVKPYTPTTSGERVIPTTNYNAPAPTGAAPSNPQAAKPFVPGQGLDFDWESMKHSPLGQLLARTLLKRGEPFPR